MMVSFVDWAMSNFANCMFGVCGKTVDSAVKNIIQPYINMSYANGKYRLRWKKTEKILEVSRGSVKNYFEVFGGKDESSASLIQGRTLAGVLLDEVVLMPQSFVNQALARCSVHGSKLWFSCNPSTPNHWFYKNWIQQADKHNALYIHFEMTDNPSLSPEILKRYQTDYTGVFYDRYILGKWVLAEGLVYPNFDKSKNIITTAPARVIGDYYISIDYGTTNPTVYCLWQVINGKAVLAKEYYYYSRTKGNVQKDDEQYYSDLEDFAKGYQIKRLIIDPSAASFKATIRKHGKFAVWDANNDVINGIRFTASLLNSGKIKIHESCIHTIEEFGLYSWDKTAGEDKVVKENDHAMDAIRYFANTIMNRYN